MSASETKNRPESVPAEVYTREYFETCCDGYQEYIEYGGEVLPLRLEIPFRFANIQSGMTILDVGCGRGEILRQCARKGAIAWGMDYAFAAVNMTAEYIARDKQVGLAVMQANARQLPVANESIDVAFMLDVVEHLYPHELHEAFVDIFRVLKPGGKLIVHTMPNLWYYAWGYPVFRLFQRLRGKTLPANPRLRWAFSEVHVNEQDPKKLHTSLVQAGYKPQVWLQSTQSYAEETNALFRSGMKLLTSLPLLKRIFCNDIFAIATK